MAAILAREESEEKMGERRQLRSAQKCLITAATLTMIVIGLATLSQSRSAATADYARKSGQPCASCHVRPEGGGELSATGAAYVKGGYEWPVPASVHVYAPPPAIRAIKLIVGYIHLTMSVIWFGAIFYIHIFVRPWQLITGLPKGEKTLGWIGISVMATTGTVLAILRHLETGSVFSGTFGRVFIVKLIQFGVMVILAAIVTFVLDRRMRQIQRTLTTGSQPAAPGSGSEAITPETLASFDGKGGGKAIVAVQGKLYDVTGSRLWRDGLHMRKHQAGRDLSEELKGAPHGPEVLERVPMIGELQSAPAKTQPRRPPAQRLFISFAYTNLVLIFGILLCVAWWKWGFSLTAKSPVSEALALSEESSRCITCHRSKGFMRAQIGEWEQSSHATANVGCYECHRAEATDPDAMAHNGYTVSVLATPNDCARCHVRETEEFAGSRHSRGGDILDSLDNVLGEKVEGLAATVLGCQQCHGAPVRVEPGGTLSPASWPNTGIGRINPDGSRGACSTCHTRHLFSVAVAREPDSCGNCHLGPDHPQKEIYEESKHGIAFVANRERMNLDGIPWVLGEDYTAAPTCATCHMSALPDVPVNHDVGRRIAWSLRPEISPRQENWEERRGRMMQVCQQCHAPGFYQNFFIQFDDAVKLYNDKFALPAQEVMKRLREAGKLTKLDFDEQIEWTFFFLWHHEGRRARHGAAMMGPDYVQWHGFYEVADRFYNEFLPEAETILPGVTQPFLQEEYHSWRRESQSP